VTLGGAQVDEPPLGEDVDLAVAEVVFHDMFADRPDAVAGKQTQRRKVDLDVEVAGVRQDRSVGA